MFWKCATATSNINTLLKEDGSLEKILEESDVLQEVTGGNRALIEYLLRPENLFSLVTSIVTEPSADKPEAVRYKFANTASEILSGDVHEIREILSKDSLYLKIVCGFLDQEGQLNPLLASFFSKVLGNLISKKPQQQWINYEMSCLVILEYLKGRENFISRVQTHLNTSAVMDLLLKLVSHIDGFDLRRRVQEWLISEKLIERLLQLLKPCNDPATTFNAAQVICEAIRILRDYHFQNVEELKNEQVDGGGTPVEPLLAHIQSGDVITQVLESMFDGPPCEHSVVNGVQILLVFVEPRRQPSGGQPDGSAFDDLFPSTVQSTLSAVTKNLDKFHQILVDPPKKRPVLTSSTLLEIPFGATRLSVCRLLSTLIELNSVEMHEKLVELQTMNVLLDLFFKYSQNNFLHAQVERTLSAILRSVPSGKAEEEDEITFQKSEEIINSHPLLSHVLRDCRLIERILEEYDETAINDPRKSRRGYMGHLACIANNIQICSVQGVNAGIIQRIFSKLPEQTVAKWRAFLEKTLSRINSQNELLPIETVTANAMEEEERESLKLAQRQSEEAALQREFLVYQSSTLTQPFDKKFGYPISQFDDGDDPLSTPPETLVTISLPEDSEELPRRQALFEAACDEKIDHFGDDEIWADRGELGFTSPGKSPSASRCRDLSLDKSSSSSSDDDSDQEVENVRMEVDPSDPWSSFAVRPSDPPQFDNPWDSQTRDATSFAVSDNWANFENVEFGGNLNQIKAENKDNVLMDCSDNSSDRKDEEMLSPKDEDFVPNFEGILSSGLKSDEDKASDVTSGSAAVEISAKPLVANGIVDASNVER